MKSVIRSLTIGLLVILSLNLAAQNTDTTQVQAGVPLIYKKDTLFYFYSRFGPFKPEERVHTIEKRIVSLVSDSDFDPDSLYVAEFDNTSDVMWREIVVFSVTEGDAKILNTPRQKVSENYKEILREKLTADIKSSSIKSILIQTGLTILEILILYFLIRYVNKLFVFTKKWILKVKDKYLKGVKIRDYEFLDAKRQLTVVLFLNNVLRWLVIIIVIYLALPILFSIFPWTRGLADTLFGYVWDPVKRVASALISYIPNLFAIAVIYFVTRYAVRFIEFLAGEIERGSLVISGFYPDWAKPTFTIVKILLYAFMFVVIFPYLPGSDSDIFKGVSVFLGLLFSFGSSSAITNLVAGLMITYMRPFKIGDRIKIGEITGDVIEKSMLVTRVRTIKNEEITIPNSTVLSGHTINYTTSAKDLGLILHTSVTIGYDVPWKKVHELLIGAADATNGLLKEDKRKPFVFQTSLDDFYVSYQLNAYTEESHRMAAIYSDLHQNIQDKFNEGGVEIMSPHYGALRDGNLVTIPADYLPKDYQVPSFKIKKDN